MTISRSGFGDLLAPGFHSIFSEEFGRYPEQYKELFNIKTTKRQYEDDSYVTGFGTIPKKSEGEAVAFDDIFQGFDKRYTPETRSLAYRITLEMWEDELYGKMRKLPAEIGRSMIITRNQNGADIYNNAFDGTNFANGGDGKELLATDHPLAVGGTQKNELTNAANFNEASFEQALIDLQNTTDDRGKLMVLIPRKLVVGPFLEFEAMKILQTPLTPFDANHSINPLQGRLQLVVNNFLTSDNAWFILCDRHEINWFDRILPQHFQGNDFDTDDAKFKTRARWDNGWSLPWGVFGSPGL